MFVWVYYVVGVCLPLYKCPKCGRQVELSEGNYYCKVCGSSAKMVKVSVGGSDPDHLDVELRFASEEEALRHGFVE